MATYHKYECKILVLLIGKIMNKRLIVSSRYNLLDSGRGFGKHRGKSDFFFEILIGRLQIKLQRKILEFLRYLRL